MKDSPFHNFIRASHEVKEVLQSKKYNKEAHK